MIDLDTGGILHTRIDPNIQIYGEAGVLGEVGRGRESSTPALALKIRYNPGEHNTGIAD